MINVSTPTSRQNPKIYTAYGKLLDGTDTTIEGYGVATVVIIGNLAQVDFTVKIEAEDKTANKFDYGLDLILLKQANSQIPDITPIRGGRVVVFTPDKQLDGIVDYGMEGMPKTNHYWTIARLYKTQEGEFVQLPSAWGTEFLKQGDTITGTVYGTVA